MLKTRKQFILALILVIAGFGVGIYLQDLQHRKSTKNAWESNRFNYERFNRVREHASGMNESNWRAIQDSIFMELDSFMILRFRKEMDSIMKQGPRE